MPWSIPLSGGANRFSLQADAVQRTNNIFALKKAVLSGIGYGVLPPWLIADELGSGALIELAQGWHAPDLPISSAFLPAQRRNRRLAAFRVSLGQFLTAVPGVVSPDTENSQKYLRQRRSAHRDDVRNCGRILNGSSPAMGAISGPTAFRPKT